MKNQPFSFMLLEADGTSYAYDLEGNLSKKTLKDGSIWAYEWNASGMLAKVIRPDSEEVSFEYDALGRRTKKTFKGVSTSWVWDGNTPLHEWTDQQDVTTWLFEENSFAPIGKLKAEAKYNIVSDYLGTPFEMYDQSGGRVWQGELDSFGAIQNFKGDAKTDCPFRYQGQYEDAETGLYYNRFRYYSPEEGLYLSQDPIGLHGNNPNPYAYVKDSNNSLDIFGLDVTTFYHAGSLKGSIDPSKGRPNLDFNPSGKGGFYVTTDLSQAEKWAEMRGHPEITRFDVPNSELDKLKIKKFDGHSDEWGKFVTDGRKGTLAHNFDAVSGPMLANPKGGKPPKSIGSQFALFTDEAAKLFDKYKVCP